MFLRFIILFLLAILTLINLPNFPLWRDTPEFILVAFYQDIAHPAGFPFYGILSNIFTMLPFGTIAWRVNLFSLFLAVIFLFLGQNVTRQCLKNYFNEKNDKLLSYGFIAIMLLSGSFIKQAVSAEVYILNAIGVLLLFKCFLSFKEFKDTRYILSASFLAGLFLGNHITFLLALLVVPFIWFRYFKELRNITLVSLLLFIFGLTVYLYLPLRSFENLPLNTGGIASNTNINISSLIAHVSNQRDKEMRVQSKETKTISSSFAKLKRDLLKDFNQLKAESNWLVLVLSLIGVAFLIKNSYELGFVSLWIVLSHWYFFKAWPPDPWMVLLAFNAFFAVIAISIIFNRLNLNKHYLVLAYLALFIFSIHFSFENLRNASNSIVALKEGEEILRKVDRDSFYLAEEDYFILNYLQNVEGYRNDINLVYLRQITHPKYFGKFFLKDSKEDINDLADFTGKASKSGIVNIEKNQELISFYKNIVNLESNGTAKLYRGKTLNIHPDYFINIEKKHSKLKKKIKNIWKPTKFEAEHYYFNKVNNEAQLLKTLGLTDDAEKVYEDACKDIVCNKVLLNNLALTYIDLKEFEKAKKILEKLLKEDSSHNPLIRQNLSILNKKTKDS